MKSIRSDILGPKATDFHGKAGRTIDMRPVGTRLQDQPVFFETIARAQVLEPDPKSDVRFGKLAAKLAVIGVVAFILLSVNIALVDALIGIYFAASLVFAIDSSRTFLVSAVFLVLVALLSAVGINSSAQDFAVYAFYFLIIGLVSAIRETLWPKIPSPKPDL